MTTPVVNAAPAVRPEKTIAEAISDLRLVPFNTTYDVARYMLLQEAVLTDDAAAVINEWANHPEAGQAVRTYFAENKIVPYTSREVLPGKELAIEIDTQATKDAPKRRFGRFVW